MAFLHTTLVSGEVYQLKDTIQQVRLIGHPNPGIDIGILRTEAFLHAHAPLRGHASLVTLLLRASDSNIIGGTSLETVPTGSNIGGQSYNETFRVFTPHWYTLSKTDSLIVTVEFLHGNIGETFAASAFHFMVWARLDPTANALLK